MTTTTYPPTMPPMVSLAPETRGAPIHYDPRGIIGRMIERHRLDLEHITAQKLREEIDRTGSHYFAPSTMKFHRSRLLSPIGIVAVNHQGEEGRGHPALVAGIGFVTSEASPFGWGKRGYTVRVAVDCAEHPHGVRITEIGEFMEHAYAARAARALANAVRAAEEPPEYAAAYARCRRLHGR